MQGFTNFPFTFAVAQLVARRLVVSPFFCENLTCKGTSTGRVWGGDSGGKARTWLPAHQLTEYRLQNIRRYKIWNAEEIVLRKKEDITRVVADCVTWSFIAMPNIVDAAWLLAVIVLRPDLALAGVGRKTLAS